MRFVFLMFVSFTVLAQPRYAPNSGKPGGFVGNSDPMSDARTSPPSEMNSSPNPTPSENASEVFQGTTIQAEEVSPNEGVDGMSRQGPDQPVDYNTGPDSNRIPRERLDRP
ncbi:MAG: hypothetical protein AB7I27_09200 [Bacteriovoracaceae bacterium]